MKTDIKVIRMTAAVLSTMFGSLWLALYFSAMVAPPEPAIATFGRYLCLLLFILSTIWALWLYRTFRAEVKRSGDEKEENPKDP